MTESNPTTADRNLALEASLALCCQFLQRTVLVYKQQLKRTFMH